VTRSGNLGEGCPRLSAYVRLRRQVRELGEIHMASMELATLDLVTHDDAQPAFPVIHLPGRAFRIPGGNEGGRIGCGRQPGAAAGPWLTWDLWCRSHRDLIL
jgi:hypothetical protein